jgi:hypothetical protein
MNQARLRQRVKDRMTTDKQRLDELTTEVQHLKDDIRFIRMRLAKYDVTEEKSGDDASHQQQSSVESHDVTSSKGQQDSVNSQSEIEKEMTQRKRRRQDDEDFLPSIPVDGGSSGPKSDK